MDHALGYVELHCPSAFSLLRAGSSVETLVARAAQQGMSALALTDSMTLAGVVRFQTACVQHGVRPLVGVELAVADPVFGDAAAPAQLVALAQNATGYARLCALLTEANLQANLATSQKRPVVPFSALAAETEGLIVLTGGRAGTLARLLLGGKRHEAEEVAQRYAEVFGPAGVFVELQHHRLPESTQLMQQLVWLAERAGLRCVATNGVRYATREAYPLYDLLTCVRLGLSVDTPHAERPQNDEQYLKSADELAALFAPLPYGPAALATSAQIAARCDLSLLKAICTAPRVPLPPDQTPASQLRALCEHGLDARLTQRATRASITPGASTPGASARPIHPTAEATVTASMVNHVEPAMYRDALTYATRSATAQGENERHHAYRRQLAHELEVIATLELEDFFLCVHDIVAAGRGMGIRCSGRGSAANSLVAYLLGITGVDPLQHGLLFERFLTPDRRGMPDIDLDIQSDRREELIRYVERTYTERHVAMVANVITYRPRSAVRDTAKALGYPLPLVNRLTRVLHHFSDPEDLPSVRDEFERIMAPSGGERPGGQDSGDSSETDLDASTRARCLARLPLLLQLAGQLCGLPRHLSLHNGGMTLSREPLAALLPVRVSANGVRALEVDKDDVERLGLIKFDLLGLRTLGAVEEALTLIEETTGERPDMDTLPTDPPDPRTMRLIRSGQTLAVFQIESPGQWHLLAQTQPERFDDLIVQTALFRPGPLQANMVHPFVERRQRQLAQQQLAQQLGQRPVTRQLAAPTSQQRDRTMDKTMDREEMEHRGRTGQMASQLTSQPTSGAGTPQRDAVQTPWRDAPADDFWTAHPVLGPILADSQGILLFQEQILEIAHAFAGLSYAEADGFRRAMSHARTRSEMAAMRERFLHGATARGEQLDDAERVFDAISQFVGYGFCKSHAAEFARTIYQTAWLKAYYPAHYLAAFLSSQLAGFFPPHVVLEEAKRLGIPALGVDLNRSADRFIVERVGAAGHPWRWAIRIGLRQVSGVGEELAEAILWERRREGVERPFTSLEDVCVRLRRVGLTREAAEALTLAGACDRLRPRLERRQQLWRLRELWPLTSPPHPSAASRRRGQEARRGEEREALEQPEQLTLAWEPGLEDAFPEMTAGAVPGAVPALPSIDREERLALDYQLLGLSAQPHPMRLLRRELRRRGVRPIAELDALEAGRGVRVAGWPISVQRPPSARGMGFLVLEDETGRLPVALPPQLAEQMRRVVREARVVLVAGRVERVRWYRSLLAVELRPLTESS